MKLKFSLRRKVNFWQSLILLKAKELIVILNANIKQRNKHYIQFKLHLNSLFRFKNNRPKPQDNFSIEVNSLKLKHNLNTLDFIAQLEESYKDEEIPKNYFELYKEEKQRLRERTVSISNDLIEMTS